VFSAVCQKFGEEKKMTAMMQQEKEKPGLLARYVPILHWLPHYNKAWLSGDIVAGLSVWALMVPQCLGFAAICGVPVQYGLYAAAIALIVCQLAPRRHRAQFDHRRRHRRSRPVGGQSRLQ
jgi:hypothetical protein